MAGINNRRQQLLVGIFLLACTFLVYGQVIHHGFANYDDPLYVTHNAYIQNGLTASSLSWAFSTIHAANWHPLTWLSLMVDHDIYGLHAGGYHLTNILLHAINALILFFILHRMTGAVGKSSFVAVLFALHPLHVESVAWISARKDVLSTFFWLLTIWAYIYYVTRPGIKRYLMVLALFIFGLMAKPMVVTLPFVLILLDYWPLNRFAVKRAMDNHKKLHPEAESLAERRQTLSFPQEGPTKDDCNVLDSSEMGRWHSIERKRATFLVLEKIPLLILATSACIVTYLAQQQVGAVQTFKTFPFDVRFVNAIISYAGYIGKMLWPMDLSVFYPHPGIWPFGKVFLSGCSLLTISFLVFFSIRRYPYLAVGWLWYLGALVPVIGIVQVGAQAMADRYTYIPLIGLFIMLAWGVSDLFKKCPYRKAILGGCFVLIVVVMSILSWQRCQLWGNNLVLWEDVLKHYPVAFAYNIRGAGYADQGQYQKAIEDYNAALKIDHDFVEAINNRANAYGAMGQNERALNDFERAARLNPNFADTYYNRGIIYKNIGNYDLAIEDFTAAIRINPDMADAFLNRGSVFLKKLKYDKAFADYNQALKINRNFVMAYYNRGTIYIAYKQYHLAIADFDKALTLKPDYADAYNNMGFSLDALGRVKEAMIYYSAALRIQPNHAEANNNMGFMLTRMGKHEEAITHFKKVLQVKPNDIDAARNLQALNNRKSKE